MPSNDEQLNNVRSDLVSPLKCSFTMRLQAQGLSFNSLNSLNMIDAADDLHRQIALLSIVSGQRTQPQSPTHHPQHHSPKEPFQTSHQAATLAISDCTDRRPSPPLRLLNVLHSGAKLHSPSTWLGRSPSSQRQRVQKLHLACISCRVHKSPCSAPSPGSVDKSCK